MWVSYKPSLANSGGGEIEQREINPVSHECVQELWLLFLMRVFSGALF